MKKDGNEPPKGSILDAIAEKQQQEAFLAEQYQRNIEKKKKREHLKKLPRCVMDFLKSLDWRHIVSGVIGAIISAAVIGTWLLITRN